MKTMTFTQSLQELRNLKTELFRLIDLEDMDYRESSIGKKLKKDIRAVRKEFLKLEASLGIDRTRLSELS